MRKLLMFLLCFGLIGSAVISSGDEPEQKISEMKFRKVVILGRGVDAKLAFQYANSYRAVVWYKETKDVEGIAEPGPAMKELINELKDINATGEEWEFIIPGIGEEYFLITLNNMDKGALSNATGTVYLPDSSKNKSIENEVQRVSDGSFVVTYGQ